MLKETTKIYKKKSKQNMYNIFRKIFKFLNLFVSLKIIVEMQKCNTKYFVYSREVQYLKEERQL